MYIKKDQPITLENLAKIFKQETGLSAQIRSINIVLNWAENNPRLFKIDFEDDIILIEDYEVLS